MSSINLVRSGLATPFTGQLAQIKLRLRRKVPKLNANDVRREKIVYYEAITSELYEEGHINAAFLVLHLIEYEDEYVRPTSNPSVESRRLRNSRPLLDYFRELLARAETFKQRGTYDSEVWQLQTMARRLADDPEKHWLARQLFLIALDRSVDCSQMMRLQWGALVRYYYAKLLVDERNLLEAMKILELAEKSLEGYTTAQEEPSDGQYEKTDDDLTVLISTLLFEVNHQLAEDCKMSPAWIREQFIRDGHKAALKTRHPAIMAKSYFSYGRFLFSDGQYLKALEKYKEAFRQVELEGTQQHLLCSIAVAQATTYHRQVKTVGTPSRTFEDILDDLNQAFAFTRASFLFRLKQPSKCEAMFQLVDRRTRDEASPSLCRANYLFTAAVLEVEDEPHSQERIEWLTDRLQQAGNTFRHYDQEDKTVASRCLAGLLQSEQRFTDYASELLPAAISTTDDALYRVISLVGF